MLVRDPQAQKRRRWIEEQMLHLLPACEDDFAYEGDFASSAASRVLPRDSTGCVVPFSSASLGAQFTPGMQGTEILDDPSWQDEVPPAKGGEYWPEGHKRMKLAGPQ